MKVRSVFRALVAVVLLAGGAAEAGRREHDFPLGKEAWKRAILELGADPSEVIYPFDSTPEMAAWVESMLARYKPVAPIDRLRMLQRVLFDPGDFEFEYDAPVNLTGSEAFVQRRGNCMAFTAMFVALSRLMGLETFLVAVTRDPPRVERDNGVVVVSRHVIAGYSHGTTLYLFDFYTESDIPHRSQRPMNDVQASAIFHTNLGGNAIREGDLESAGRHLELATLLDPGLAPAWVNLGVTRSRMGDLEGALEAYGGALRADPDQPSALTNMAHVYRQQGRPAEAQAALRAAAEGRSSPFTLIALADIERARGEIDRARGLLHRARRTHPKVPEIFDALARLEIQAGNPGTAARHHRKAEKLRAASD